MAPSSSQGRTTRLNRPTPAGRHQARRRRIRHGVPGLRIRFVRCGAPGAFRGASFVCGVVAGSPFIRWDTSDSFCGSGVFLRFECAFTCGGRVRGALRLLEHDGFVLWCWCSSLFCRFKCASTCVEWGREGHSVVGTRAMVRGCQRAQRGMFCVEGGGAKAVRLLEHDGFVLCSWRSSSNRSDSFCAVGVLLLFGDSNALLRV